MDEFKFDDGKAPLSLVPLQILEDISRVREFAIKNKYPNIEGWRNVSVERYRDAMFRHLVKYINDPYGNDSESGLPHLYHLACNVAFLCELEHGKLATRYTAEEAEITKKALSNINTSCKIVNIDAFTTAEEANDFIEAIEIEISEPKPSIRYFSDIRKFGFNTKLGYGLIVHSEDVDVSTTELSDIVTFKVRRMNGGVYRIEALINNI